MPFYSIIEPYVYFCVLMYKCMCHGRVYTISSTFLNFKPHNLIHNHNVDIQSCGVKCVCICVLMYMYTVTNVHENYIEKIALVFKWYEMIGWWVQSTYTSMHCLSMCEYERYLFDKNNQTPILHRYYDYLPNIQPKICFALLLSLLFDRDGEKSAFHMLENVVK